MNNHFTYFAILGGALAGPMALSFDKKVCFYTKWKYLFPAMVIPAIFYIIWDIFFTKSGVWYFNENYITGIKFINLPIEEVLFFFIVPFCCVFIYECIRCYFPDIKNKVEANITLNFLALILLIAGIFFYQKLYTFYTFIFTAVYIALIYFKKKYFKTFDSFSFFVAYIIMLFPFLIVNGFLTAIPVVIYNNTQNLSLRIYTIPLEDVFYGFLLIIMNVTIYEKLKNRVA